MKDQEKNVLTLPEEIIIDMNSHLPGNLTISDIQRIVRGRPFKVSFYLTDDLLNTDIADMDMSVRATNALKRAGYLTVGDIFRRDDFIESLGKIRNCGAKSKAEIQARLFSYQYSLIPNERRSFYMKRIMELNGIK